MATKSPSIEVEAGEHTVRVSNPDRVYFPELGLTKLDLVNYYLSVGDGIVRALRERPVHAAPLPGRAGRREGAPEAGAARRAAVAADGAGRRSPATTGTPTSCA